MMPTEVKCTIEMCKYQFDGLCTRGEIEVDINILSYPEELLGLKKAVCQTMRM